MIIIIIIFLFFISKVNSGEFQVNNKCYMLLCAYVVWVSNFRIVHFFFV